MRRKGHYKVAAIAVAMPQEKVTEENVLNHLIRRNRSQIGSNDCEYSEYSV